LGQTAAGVTAASTHTQRPASASQASSGSSRFAALYQGSSKRLVRVAFETTREFEDLGDSVLPAPGHFALLLLQGYPSPEWLNALGARFGIDPEFFQRHLVFASGSGKGGAGGASSKRTATSILPSCHGDMVSLQISKIGSRQSSAASAATRYADHGQERLDQLRKKASEEMTAYMSKLATLNSPGVMAADSVAREFSVHDLDYFSLEQTVSVGTFAAGQGWVGRCLAKSLPFSPFEKSSLTDWRRKASSGTMPAAGRSRACMVRERPRR